MTRQEIYEMEDLRTQRDVLRVALEMLPCPICEHSLREHVDPYGCERDMGDKQIQDVGAVAKGPCHCNAENDLDFQTAIRALRIVNHNPPVSR